MFWPSVSGAVSTYQWGLEKQRWCVLLLFFLGVEIFQINRHDVIHIKVVCGLGGGNEREKPELGKATESGSVSPRAPAVCQQQKASQVSGYSCGGGTDSVPPGGINASCQLRREKACLAPA